MDTVMHWFSLAFPAVFLIGGLAVVIGSVIGSPKMFENSKNPQVQDQIARIGKTKTRIVNGIGGLLMAAFGGYLLYCWIFGPIG